MIRKLAPKQKVKMPGWWPEDISRSKFQEVGPRSFEQGFRQRPWSANELIFPHFQEGIAYFFDEDWRYISDPSHEAFIGKTWPRYMGCDLSTSCREGNVIFIIAINPETAVRHVIDVRIGDWTAPEFADQIQAADREYNVELIFVENNAYQGTFTEWMQDKNLPCWTKVEGFNTGKTKLDPEIGLPSLDVQYSTHKWHISVPHAKYEPVFPNPKNPIECYCGICRFIRDTSITTFDDLTPDSVMACWLAKEASKRGEKYIPSIHMVRVSGQEIRRQTEKIVSQKISIPHGMSSYKALFGGINQRKNKDGFGRTIIDSPNTAVNE